MAVAVQHVDVFGGGGRTCRCTGQRRQACRSRPSRHSGRSWVAVPAAAAAPGDAKGCGPRPATAQPSAPPRPPHRPATAPAPRRAGHGRGPGGGVPVQPALPEDPEERLGAWSRSDERLHGAGAARDAVPPGEGGSGHRKAVPDEADERESLREKLAADVMVRPLTRPRPGEVAGDAADGAAPRPPTAGAQTCRTATMDDGSVRSSVVTAASLTTSTAGTSRTDSGTGTVTATTATGTAGTSGSSGSRGTSRSGGSTDEFGVPRAPGDLDPLAARIFQDDAQGSGHVLPVRVEAGTDPVLELGGVLDRLEGGKLTARQRRRDGRSGGHSQGRGGLGPRRVPARYRVPLSAYHPTLQAMQGRRSRSEGGGPRSLGAVRVGGGRDANEGVGGGRPPPLRLGSAGAAGAGAKGRRRRLERLAEPRYRHDVRAHRSALRPNLSVGPEPIWPISKAALRALPTPRVSRLSMVPSWRSELRTDTSRCRSAAAAVPPRAPRSGSGSVSGSSRVSARLEALSKPRLHHARAHGEAEAAAGGSRSQRRLMSDLEWRRHKEWMRVNAQPRPDHSLLQRKVRRGRSASLRRLLPRLRVLARPSQRAITKPTEPQLRTVSRGALRYQASEHTIRLSRPLQRRLSTIAKLKAQESV